MSYVNKYGPVWNWLSFLCPRSFILQNLSNKCNTAFAHFKMFSGCHFGIVLLWKHFIWFWTLFHSWPARCHPVTTGSDTCYWTEPVCMQLCQPSQHHWQNDLCRRSKQRSLSGKTAQKIDSIKRTPLLLWDHASVYYFILFSFLCRVTRADHCNANKEESGFRLVSPVLECLVPDLDSLKSMPGSLSLNSGYLITWRGQTSVLCCSAPMAPTPTATLPANPQRHFSRQGLCSSRQ